MNILRPTLLALACTFSLASFAANDLPALGDASSAIVSPEQEHKLGRAWLSMLRGQVRQLNDPLLKEYVEQSVYRLAETSQLRDRRLEFIVLASPQLNAFAAPGGIIGVNGGLFLHAQTEAEYASVMAHELAHLSQRHFARGVEAQKRMQLPMMAALLAGIVAAAAGAGDAGMAAIVGSQAAAYQTQARYSRLHEQEADRIGLTNLERAGYDPMAMPEMFERLVRLYRYDQRPPEFLSTHPLTDNRIADARGRAEQLYRPNGIKDSLRYQLMRARVMLRFEETPGVAVKRFNAQLSENKNAQAARYGLALALTKSGRFDEARTHLDILLKQKPKDIIYNLSYAELDLASNKTNEAYNRVQRMLTTYPNSFPLQQLKADILFKQGKNQETEQVLEKIVAKRPNDPDIWLQLAEVRGLNNNIIGLHQARAEYFAKVGEYEQAIQQLDLAKRRAANNFTLAARIDARQRELIQEERAIKEMM
ncbi:M48 family metalloprotease [Pseudomonas sp. F1_0610]|uniref:M48 family metalloprotease n=1 Tax=Pseudomonas sp. F1_0610 TaxID=3114284 RepID=UPI0039C1E418